MNWIFWNQTVLIAPSNQKGLSKPRLETSGLNHPNILIKILNLEKYIFKIIGLSGEYVCGQGKKHTSVFMCCWQWERLAEFLWSDERRWRSCRAAPERSAARWAPSCHTEQRQTSETLDADYSQIQTDVVDFSGTKTLTATPLFSISWKTVLMGTEKQSDSWQPLCCGSEGVMMRTWALCGWEASSRK